MKFMYCNAVLKTAEYAFSTDVKDVISQHGWEAVAIW